MRKHILFEVDYYVSDKGHFDIVVYRYINRSCDVEAQEDNSISQKKSAQRGIKRGRKIKRAVLYAKHLLINHLIISLV